MRHGLVPATVWPRSGSSKKDRFPKRTSRGIRLHRPLTVAAFEQGDPSAAEQLLPLVYDELRRLAARKMAIEKAGQTLQATALVHEAYIRLVDTEKARHWDSRRHFFGAAEAVRRILVERARRKRRQRHGGGEMQVPDNLQVLTGEARCGQPTIQRVLEVE